MSCYNHPNASSVNTCSNCGKDICAACVTDFNEKVVCRDCAEKLRKEAPLAPPAEETTAAPVQAEPSKETMPAPVPETTPTALATPASQSPEAPKSPEQPSSASAPAEKKEPILSLLLSVIVPGLGQFYNKQVQKGIILLVGYILLWLVVFVLASRTRAFCCITFWVPLIVMIYAAYDAYSTSKKINDGQAVKDWLS